MINWDAIGVVSGIVVLVGGAVGTYVKLSIAASRDTAVPVAQLPQIPYPQMQQFVDLQTQINEMKQANLTARVAELERHLAASQQEVNSVRAENERLRAQVSDLEDDNRRLRQRVDDLEDRARRRDG